MRPDSETLATCWPAQPSWDTPLAPILSSPRMPQLFDFLQTELAHGKVIYPQPTDWFRALTLTPLPSVRVVILGQDPYHGPGQAHGLAFSVPPGVPPPPSLRNIFREVQHDLGQAFPSQNGDLSRWAKQGVLLLNTILTVEAGKPQSHSQKGWEYFTDSIVSLVDRSQSHVVFLLWGKSAIAKKALIANPAHRILMAPHPSPLSAHRGFFGCKHFSQTNAYLVDHGLSPVDW